MKVVSPGWAKMAWLTVGEAPVVSGGTRVVRPDSVVVQAASDTARHTNPVIA